MKIATTTGDFSRYTSRCEEAIEYIKAAGFSYADYNFCTDYQRGTGIFSGGDMNIYLEQLKARADALGIKFVQAHAPMGQPITNNENQIPFIKTTKKCIEACGRLGIKNIVVHSGWEQGVLKEENFKKNKAFFSDILKTAENYEVNILVENFNKMCLENTYWVDNAPDLKELIELVGHPLFHACWDIGHANLQEMPQDEAMKILGSDLYAVHAQDNLGDIDSHLAPYFGTTNYDAVMHGLLDIGYNGYFTFEANVLLSPQIRRPYAKDDRLLTAPLDIHIKAEKLLYDIGKHILTSYNCFEE